MRFQRSIAPGIHMRMCALAEGWGWGGWGRMLAKGRSLKLTCSIAVDNLPVALVVSACDVVASGV